MTEEKTTRLRERMIEDMRIRGMGDKAQKGYIRISPPYCSAHPTRRRRRSCGPISYT
ncbi:hypothetical protein [Sinorhizobium fredii]|uniref:hypothetical protein n=1 Tax=Rhizobium fredii TaxID=380 RepID=UPI001F0A5A36|nr:hypothetical protein [Sinorhizobium fredii]